MSWQRLKIQRKRFNLVTSRTESRPRSVRGERPNAGMVSMRPFSFRTRTGRYSQSGHIVTPFNDCCAVKDSLKPTDIAIPLPEHLTPSPYE